MQKLGLSFLYIALVLISLLSLSSCAYHLRGSMALSPKLQSLYLQTDNPYDQLTRNIILYLKMSGVRLATRPAMATTILDIQAEHTTEQLLGISGTQQTRQYNLILTVTYQITDKNGNSLIPPQTASETRSLTINANQMLGSSNQAVNLYQQMRQAIAYDILSRLASHEITVMLSRAP